MGPGVDGQSKKKLAASEMIKASAKGQEEVVSQSNIDLGGKCSRVRVFLESFLMSWTSTITVKLQSPFFYI